MSLESEFTVDYGAKTVTHTSGVTVYTVLAFFQWLAAKFAAESQMDDDYAFVSDTPQVYRWVNGWDMGDEVSYQFLKSGAIETSDAQKLFSNLFSIGSQFRNSMIYIIQDDAEITPWWVPGNIDILIKVKTAGELIAEGKVMVMSRDSDALYDHNEADLSAGGRNPVGVNTFEDLNYKETGDIYLDVDTVANFDIGNFTYGATSHASGRIQYVDTPNTRLYLCQVEGTFQTAETINERATRTGSNLDGTATNHVSTAEFEVIKGYDDILYTFVQRKFEGGTSSGAFIVGETINQASSGWVGKFAAEVSNVLYVENTSGAPDATGQLVGATSGKTYTPTSTAAQTTVLKDLNNGAGAKPYRVVVDCAGRSVLQIYQYLKYITNHNSAETVNGDSGEEYRSALEGTYTDAKQAPFGTFAGGTFFGARGVWVEDYAIATFSLTDANGDLQNPPNYKKVSVGHASLVGCQILIAERTGAAIIKNQYTIQSTTTNSITCTGSIDANKCPQSGSLRVGDWRATYTGFSGAVFTGVSPDPSGKTGDLYVPQLDILADAVSEESANIILAAAFDVKARVRKYGYKDYTMDTSFPTTGLAITPILAVDPQAT